LYNQERSLKLNFHHVSFVASYGLLQQIPPSRLPEIVFSGRSNVGKSSLINKLFNRKGLARVSATPGKTATINFFDLDGTLHIVDLPGYGYAKVGKQEKLRWSELIEGYLGDESRDLRLVVQLIDARHAPSALDRAMLDYLIETERPFVVALTKMDKLNRSERVARLQTITGELPYGDQITIIPFSSETGEGVEALREILEELAAEEKTDSAE
jgi:GTP-binding protein